MKPLLAGRFMFLLLMAMTACAPSYLGRVSAAPSDQEARVLEDAGDRRIASFERAAMVVGGPTKGADIDTALTALRQRLAPALAQVSAVPEAKRPQDLLRALFATQVLRERAEDATTLYDVVSAGRYNDVSAAMVYMVAASLLGLDARPFLLPTHVRLNVYLNGVPMAVDPSGLDGSETLPVYGEESDVVGLLAAVYSNIAVGAIDLRLDALAEKVGQRGEALCRPRERRLLQEQRAYKLAALAQQATRTIDDALRLSAQARRLANDDALIASIDQDVLARVARHAEAFAAKITATEITRIKALLEPFAVAADGHATLLEGIASWQISRLDLSAAAKTLAGALAAARDPPLIQRLRETEVYRLAALSESDPLGAARTLMLTVYSPQDENAKAIAHNELALFADAGRCDEQQTAQTKWSEVLPEVERDELLAYCFTVRAQQLFASNDYSRLVSEMRVAARTVPKDDKVKQTLKVALKGQVATLLGEFRCDAAKPLLMELKRLDPMDQGTTQDLRYCSQR